MEQARMTTFADIEADLTRHLSRIEIAGDGLDLTVSQGEEVCPTQNHRLAAWR